MATFLKPGPVAVRYRLGRDVVLVRQDGVVRLLDMGRGTFYALSSVGSQMLSLVLESGSAETAQHIARQYRAPVEQVRADLKNLLRDLQRRQLLVCQPYGPRVPGHLSVLLLLACAWLSVRVVGWAGSVRLWRNWQRRERAGYSLEEAASAVRSVDRLVRDAAACHLLNPQCKERALVGWHILRKMGLPAEMVVGAAAFPFSLHVWVECGPWVATDDLTQCEQYPPVARY